MNVDGCSVRASANMNDSLARLIRLIFFLRYSMSHTEVTSILMLEAIEGLVALRKCEPNLALVKSDFFTIVFLRDWQDSRKTDTFG